MAANLGFPSSAGLRDQLERAIEESGADDEDPLSPHERSMLRNLLGFSSHRVSELMVPRPDIVAISDDRPLGELLRLFSKAGHSRIPVYKGSLDNPIGMIHIKDALSWATREAREHTTDGVFDLGCIDLTKSISETDLAREVLFVPPSMSAVELLARMQARHIHLALVVDEFGGTDGLVSIEDLVEEIVGDIEDEHDTREAALIAREGNAFVASARAPIEEVEEAVGANLSAEASAYEVDTLGGLILAMVGFVPKRGHVVTHPAGLRFEVLDASPRRINKIRIEKQLALPEPAEPLLLPAPGKEASDMRANRPNARAA